MELRVRLAKRGRFSSALHHFRTLDRLAQVLAATISDSNMSSQSFRTIELCKKDRQWGGSTEYSLEPASLRGSHHHHGPE